MSEEKYTILAVDDVEQNLDILVETLSDDYDVAIALDGPTALEVADQICPDLVLLDIMMPGMDGYEVCEKLKKMPSMRDVPVIFVTAMSDINNEMRGFEVGGEDYITKPYNPAIILARVQTHLNLFTARRSLKDMLDKTLKGSVHLLTDILSLASPAAFGQSSRVRRHVRAMVKELDLPSVWRFELAAMLSQLGCVTLPGETLNEIFLGNAINSTDREAFEEHPQVGAELLMHIPRLETVAQMVARQRDPIDVFSDTPVEDMDIADLGGQLIRMAVDFDDLSVRGMDTEEVLASMDNKSVQYLPGFMELFSKVVRNTALKMTYREIKANEVSPGMILDQDVISDTGALVVRKGMEVSSSVYNILKRMGNAGKIRMTFRVLIPS